MHDGMPYGRIQGQGQGHSREVDRQSPTGLIFDFDFNGMWFYCPAYPMNVLFSFIKLFSYSFVYLVIFFIQLNNGPIIP